MGTTSFRPNRQIAPSQRGLRAVDAEEERAREQILREIERTKTKAAAHSTKGVKK
jgi:hypothetical protein